MNKILNLATVFFTVIVLLPVSSRAQDEMALFLLAEPQDAEGLIEQYMDSYFRGFGYGLNNGWYNTAAVHKKLGFEILLTVNSTFIPSSGEFFNLRPEYTSVALAPGETNDQLPTFFGPEDAPLLEFNNSAIGAPIQDNSVAGVGDDLPVNVVPVPMIQAGIGLLFGTDLKARYSPPIEIEGFETSFWGIALQHSISQHIGAFGEQAPIDISIIGAWTDINGSLNIDILNSGEYSIAGQNQKGEMDVNSWNVQLLVSKKISVLTLYGGLGFNGYSGDYDLLGTYVITPVVGNSVTYTDPVTIESSDSNFKATLGARLKFGLFAIFADYSFNDYNQVTFGLGVSLREK